MKVKEVTSCLTYYVTMETVNGEFQYRTDMTGVWETVKDAGLTDERWESVYDTEELDKAFNEYWSEKNLIVSQPTQPAPTEQSIHRLNRPDGYSKMKGWKDIGQNITKNFDDRYENLGPFDDNWQELCIASALRGLIGEFKEVYEIDDGEDDEYGVDFMIKVRDIKQIISELEK